jgi:hypothetical protein
MKHNWRRAIKTGRSVWTYRMKLSIFPFRMINSHHLDVDEDLLYCQGQIEERAT